MQRGLIQFTKELCEIGTITVARRGGVEETSEKDQELAPCYIAPPGKPRIHLPMQEKQEKWVWSLSWEDPGENEMATHSSISCLENSMDRRTWQATVHGVAKSRTRLSMHACTHARMQSIWLWRPAQLDHRNAIGLWEIETPLLKGAHKVSWAPGLTENTVTS